MRRKSVNTFVKRMTAGALTVAMVVAGFVIAPKTAEAANEQSVHYTLYTDEDFRTLSEAKKAPTEDGYVFGGWYQGPGETKTALTKDTVSSATGNIYAKFVPAYVLSVKAQNQSGTKADSVNTSIRILSSVDSIDYQEMGITLYLANRTEKDMPVNTKVYQKLKVGDNTLTAKEVFGTASEYFSVWRLTDIANSNFPKIMYVRPYWKTMDGTTVYGLAKYVHIEDGYEKYISVPINLMSDADVAAGVVEMGYSSEDLEFHDFENGRVFTDEMEINKDTAGKVKMVGNYATVDHYAPDAECLYANVRFTVKNGSSIWNTPDKGAMTRSKWFDFDVTPDFSDWTETTKDAGAWGLQY